MYCLKDSSSGLNEAVNRVCSLASGLLLQDTINADRIIAAIIKFDNLLVFIVISHLSFYSYIPTPNPSEEGIVKIAFII
jgi:hypothetical protein